MVWRGHEPTGNEGHCSILCPQVWRQTLAFWGPDQPPASPGPQHLEHREGYSGSRPGEALQVIVQEEDRVERVVRMRGWPRSSGMSVLIHTLLSLLLL